MELQRRILLVVLASLAWDDFGMKRRRKRTRNADSGGSLNGDHRVPRGEGENMDVEVQASRPGPSRSLTAHGRMSKEVVGESVGISAPLSPFTAPTSDGFKNLK